MENSVVGENDADGCFDRQNMIYGPTGCGRRDRLNIYVRGDESRNLMSKTREAEKKRQKATYGFGMDHAPFERGRGRKRRYGESLTNYRWLHAAQAERRGKLALAREYCASAYIHTYWILEPSRGVWTASGSDHDIDAIASAMDEAEAVIGQARCLGFGASRHVPFTFSSLLSTPEQCPCWRTLKRRGMLDMPRRHCTEA